MTTPTSADRAQFEEDIAADGYLLDVLLDWDEENERYGSSRTQPMFSGWLLARRRAAMQTAEPVAEEAVAMIGDGYQLLFCRVDWSNGLKVGDLLYTRAAPSGTPNTEPNTRAAADPRLEDLRYIVERLARKLAKADPNSGEPTGALAYLRSVGLTGSPLRAAPDRAPSTDSAAGFDTQRFRELLKRVCAAYGMLDVFEIEVAELVKHVEWRVRAIAAMQPEGGA